MDLLREHVEEIRQLCFGEMRRLRAGPDMNARVLASPCDRTVGFHVRVLDLVRVVRAFVNRVGVSEAFCHVADLAFDLHENVVLDILNTGFGADTRVQNRRPGLHGFLGVEHGGKDFVIDFDETTGFLCRSLGLGDDGNDTLPNEARDIVEHVRVIRIDVKVIMRRRRKKPTWDIFPRENRMHARRTAIALSLRIALMRA